MCVAVCCEHGVSRLVYTSTVNVVFAGKPIEDGDEDSVPCVPLDKVRERDLYVEKVNKVNWANLTPVACVCYTSRSRLFNRHVNEQVMNPRSVTLTAFLYCVSSSVIIVLCVVSTLAT